MGWLREIEEGTESARDMISQENIFPLQLVTDAHDLYAALQCERPYKGADQSITMYLEVLKEDIMH